MYLSIRSRLFYFFLSCLALFGSSHLGTAQQSYDWTTDHLQVGVRWQPFGLKKCEEYDANRPLIAKHSSYAQFWVNWNATEPTEKNVDYKKNMSGYLRAIDHAVNLCVERGMHVELVTWHCPGWASESGRAGAWRPKAGKYAEFATRLATHFKGRVGAYQLYHEVNLQGMINGADIDFVMSEIFTKGGQAIRKVYDAKPRKPVIISTSGTSPCEACGPLKGLKGKGAVAVDDYYDHLVANKTLMNVVDALNMNVSDHFNGYGMMDGLLIPNVWTQYDLARGKLDAANYRSKKMLSSESWIVWDGSGNNHDVNADGKKDERDAFDKTVTIFGKMLERGLNTINMPWCDNSSSWSMGLVKRVDYNGRVKKLQPGWVIPSNDGGPGIVTRKLSLRGSSDETFQPVEVDESGRRFTEKNYLNPGDPNHLHYYAWRWYSQLAGGSDEVIRHAMSGERENDVTVLGPGFTGNEQYKLSSYNRTKKKFIVLVYSGGASGTSYAKVSIPSTIQNGKYYNNEFSTVDFRGEGFKDGRKYQARIVTKDINRDNGEDLNRREELTKPATVANGQLTVNVGNVRRFTKIEFSLAE
jgi:hypothetical protein